ncbi:hypothetical protein H6B10_17880, partial [Gemmiger formicilis]|uniref:hypothetical protein n=1 Tax=Gemmiger formicilis TaxID=745368 RepID=UPI0019569CED
VGQYHICHIFGHIGAGNAHTDTDIRHFDGRRIVDAVTGAELDEISDEELTRAVRNYSVYARVQPEHKSRIVS